MEVLYEWVWNVAVYLLLVTAVTNVLPGDTYRKYLKFFGNLIESCDQAFFVRIIVRDSAYRCGNIAVCFLLGFCMF